MPEKQIIDWSDQEGAIAAMDALAAQYGDEPIPISVGVAPELAEAIEGVKYLALVGSERRYRVKITAVVKG